MCPREESHAHAIACFSEPSVPNDLRHGEPVEVPPTPSAVRFLANGKPFTYLQRKTCKRFLCPREESNLDCKIRNLASYPLNDEGKIFLIIL